jgi:hypothetical protein
MYWRSRSAHEGNTEEQLSHLDRPDDLSFGLRNA